MVNDLSKLLAYTERNLVKELERVKLVDEDKCFCFFRIKPIQIGSVRLYTVYAV